MISRFARTMVGGLRIWQCPDCETWTPLVSPQTPAIPLPRSPEGDVMSKVDVGQIIVGEAFRDAIHVAIAPVVAKVILWPGQAVDKDGGCDGESVGIVDPFLKTSVKPGEKFYIFIAPNTVTSLRHEWTHPTFDPVSDDAMKAAVSWVTQYASEHCPYYEEGNYSYNGKSPYERFMERVKEGEIFFAGSDLHGAYELPEPNLLFKNLSVILGRPVSAEGFEYGCTC